jgi:hypothetical protein
MAQRNPHPIEDLRLAIDCLPVETRLAMLEGVRNNDIVVGAYTTRDGGVCPMLAAHRAGGRTSMISFAHAWDGFARARGRARKATGREMRILIAHLEASLLAEYQPEMERAILEHQALRSSREAADAAVADAEDVAAAGARRSARERGRRRPGDRNRTIELRERHGWAWLRPHRRWDDYRRALERVEAERDALAAVADGGEPVVERELELA